nr:3-phosphoglycerate kinase [Tanacetum cinerariifolium]
ELDYLDGAVSNPKRPFAAIVGGSKAQGLSVGSSLVEEDKLELATTLLAKAKAKGVSLLLPTDVVIADKFAPDANSKVASFFFLTFLIHRKSIGYN